jgi:hypothetical protein
MTKIVSLKCTCCGNYDEELIKGLCTSCEALEPSYVDPNAEEFGLFMSPENGDEPWEVELASREDIEGDICGFDCTCHRCVSYDIDDVSGW